MDRETLAHLYYNFNEVLGPEHGCPAKGLRWAEIPENDKNLMLAVAGKVLEAFANEFEFAGKWISPNYAIPPIPIQADSSLRENTIVIRQPAMTAPLFERSIAEHFANRPLYALNTETNEVTPALDEDRVRVLIAEALEASEDRLVEHVFNKLVVRLRTRTLP